MQEIIDQIGKAEKFDFNQTFEIYRVCSNQLILNEDQGTRLLIRILNSRSKFSSKLDDMLADLIESVGFYPYLDKEDLSISSTSAKIRLNVNMSDHILGKIFHDEQKYLLSLLQSEKSIIVSAPTSFGKSLLIEEVVASKKFKNIVVIQPTLALLDESRKKLTKYNDHYKLIVRTSQEPSGEKGNLFLLTSERVNEYQNFPDIDFLIIDEFYKLSSKRDDERSDSLNNAFRYLLEKYKCQFCLLGPNIEGISKGFAEKYNAIFYKTNYSLVSCDEINVYEEHKGVFGDRGEKKKYKERVLFDLLFKLNNENTIIYCASPYRARYLAGEYCKYLVEKGTEQANTSLSILDWIEKYVSKEWTLIDCLKYGIGVHDGALQKHITSTVIDYFNKGTLKQLFCTATIIEGVNTTAKNVVFYDKKKGANTPIDFFDYSNIRGRAGRLMEHYVGRIYNFNEIPKKDQIYVDIPFYEQNPISDEVLININEDEVVNKESDQYHYISDLPSIEKELFSRNSLYIRGQDALVTRLRNEIVSNYDLISWEYKPTYRQLEYCLGLAWEYLLKPSEQVRPMTKKRIVKLTFDYGITQSIGKLVENSYLYKKTLKNNENKKDRVILDESIRETFQILRHWFQYKIPKWLVVVNELQKFVCHERGLRPGNYTYYASLIENDFIRENLTILSEFGIPRSAIEKVGKYIRKDLDQDQVLKEIIMKKLHEKPELLKYEKEKILENYQQDNV